MLKTFSGRRASQDETELHGFVDLLKEQGVARYCEIGARHGDTFHEVMLHLGPQSYGVAVDYPGALWGTHKSRTALDAAIADLRRQERECCAVYGDSASRAVLAVLNAYGPFDAILIDGDHTLEGVTRDWNNLRGLAPLIAFHDIVGAGQSENVSGRLVEVPQLWTELKAQFRHREFIAPGSKMGIGVLWTGP